MADLLHSAAPEDHSVAQWSLQPGVRRERKLSRSPHPYHRHGISRLGAQFEGEKQRPPDKASVVHPLLSSSSESGTEADDERGRFLRTLPAPPPRPHKGWRDAPFREPTPQSSPLGTPPDAESDGREHSSRSISKKERSILQGESEIQKTREKYTKRRRSEVVRRVIETLLLLTVGVLASYEHLSKSGLLDYGSAILCQFAIVILLYLLYPVRRVYRARRVGDSFQSSLRRGLHIPSKFDPAPLLYPLFLPLVVSASLISTSRDFILPNIILGIASLPLQTLPFLSHSPLNIFHWLLTVLPLTYVDGRAKSHTEKMTLLYPLHKYSVQTIAFLTTTSLDPAEQYLLATILVDLYLLGRSAQSEILNALLWLGTLVLFVTCQRPLEWELALARIPSWRLRESGRQPRSSQSLLQILDSTICQRLSQLVAGQKSSQIHDSEEDEEVEQTSTKENGTPKLSLTMNGLLKHPTTDVLDQSSNVAAEPPLKDRRWACVHPNMLDHDFRISRRHTMPAVESSLPRRQRTTSGRRRKRSVNAISQSFLAFTPAQAAVRRWAYAGFVYAVALVTILGPVRLYVSLFSLGGREPIGWALGYLLGNVPQFRVWVSSNALATWIHLPGAPQHTNQSQPGWVESVRQDTLGPANMRIVLCIYCLVVLLVGMAVVLKLSTTVEVDTRRKVFHGTMVAMLMPTVFIDPCFTSLALTLILAIFLLLDLFRACQLPPISRPLTAFLAPYVDGRDHRGPVIVSHTFLLIGCAIPLWLSLAGVTRGGEGPWSGWDINSRDVSMISGVVCVGMGDSAASLVGRRYGRHKWYWGGGKSLEGSMAFAAAVTVGLVAAYTWLRLGGWVLQERESPVLILGKAWLAASGASLTEAVLTGANDNVVVPIVLWLLVRGVRL